LEDLYLKKQSLLLFSQPAVSNTIKRQKNCDASRFPLMLWLYPKWSW